MDGTSTNTGRIKASGNIPRSTTRRPSCPFTLQFDAAESSEE
jgi:hypothetical protein